MVKISDDINIITKEIVEDVLELFKEKVYKIVLYGSYARGDFTKESDVINAKRLKLPIKRNSDLFFNK